MTANHYFYLPGLFVAVLSIYFVAQTLRSPLRRVPGPLSARFSRLGEVFSIYKTDYAQYIIALRKQYGPLIRLAPNRYSISDADAAKTILGHKNSLNKSHFYDIFGAPGMSNLFSETSNAIHAVMRRPIAHLYSQTSLLAYEPAVDTCNIILLKRLREYASEKKELNVRTLMQFYAFDVIGEITVGSRFGLMEDDGDKNGVIDAITDSMYYGAYVGLLPALHPWIVKVSGWFGMRAGFEKIQKFIREHLDDRLSGRTKSPEACAQTVVAGSDTTAISLTSVIGHHSTNTTALTALRYELEAATATGTLSNPPSFKEAQKLPYFRLSLMRLFDYILRQYFPPGTDVGINPWVLHHEQPIFGPDASESRPQRWISGTPEERGILDRNMIAFGPGPRTCNGKNISLMEMYKVIPQIVCSFDFYVIPDEQCGKPWSNDTAWLVWQDLKCKVREVSR
ncbi:pisatin demethylase [Plenodomus tracheiphilus IPT5]|uniref:Pisatin demethylase n=1 Tax=Plenodomus tracheiphilus IPT5 TaxID=1408161 RepID=A0A6A7AWA2_9PLEO|nr:pisatin demethylase [Plenodomus tracheiphilus IPT5]